MTYKQFKAERIDAERRAIAWLCAVTIVLALIASLAGCLGGKFDSRSSFQLEWRKQRNALQDM